MPNQKLTELTELTALTADDLIYVVNDPDGTPASRSAAISLLLGGTLGTYGGNLVRNSPGQIVTDGAEPQWWDDSGSATLTDEDTAGEGIPEITERVFQVVTVADDHYGYQTLTFTDEPLLDAGQTVVSFGCWVYATSANLASIGIFGTNLGLQESSQHTGNSTWQWLSVNNITLDGADTDIEIRLIVDTGTAHYTMPSLTVGPIARPWVPRNTTWVWNQVQVYDLNTTGDVAWSDIDCTAASGNLAAMLQARVFVFEANGTVGSYHAVTSSDEISGSDSLSVQTTNLSLTASNLNIGTVSCNDSQLLRYTVEEIDADNDVRAILRIHGYWRWE